MARPVSSESTNHMPATPSLASRPAPAFVDVLVPVALDQTYSYRVPDDLELAPGDLVSVPLGPRAVTGVVWADHVEVEPRLHNRMKEVEGKLELPPLKPELRKFVDWVAGYTLSPRGMVLRMALRMGEHLGPARERVGVRLAGPPPQRMTAARGRVLALLADALAHGKSEVAHDAGVSPGVIDGLVDEGTLETMVLPPEPVARAPDPDFAQPDFAPAQRQAADALRATRRQGRLCGHAARRRHRLRQDPGLFRGGQRGHPARTAGAGADAGDRADHPVPRSLRRALRGAAGGVALAAFASACGRAPGARSRPATSRSWSARARRCSCPMRISG